jgi:hypothetical protein
MRGGLNSLEKGLSYGLYGGLGAASGASTNTPPLMERFATAPRTNYGGPFTGENQYIEPLDALGLKSNANYYDDLDQVSSSSPQFREDLVLPDLTE